MLKLPAEVEGVEVGRGAVVEASCGGDGGGGAVARTAQGRASERLIVGCGTDDYIHKHKHDV